MADTWQPQQYARFRDQRSQPFFDLLSLVQRRPGMRVADLGCGPGELTRAMHDELVAASTVGLDSSAAMLEKAKQYSSDAVTFRLLGIEAFAARGEYDLLFSNAALHWVDDHAQLFPRLVEAVAPGGQLAVQMPCNHDHPSHRVASAVAAEAPFREALGGWQRRTPVLAPEAYATLLHRLGLRDQLVQLRVYGHELASPAEVIEWVKGSLLTAYEARLGPLYPAFLARYREQLLPLLEDERPYFYTYPRLFLWAKKPQ